MESPSPRSWRRCSPPSPPSQERCPRTPGGTTGCSSRRTGPSPPSEEQRYWCSGQARSIPYSSGGSSSISVRGKIPPCHRRGLEMQPCSNCAGCSLASSSPAPLQLREGTCPYLSSAFPPTASLETAAPAQSSWAPGNGPEEPHGTAPSTDRLQPTKSPHPRVPRAGMHTVSTQPPLLLSPCR